MNIFPFRWGIYKGLIGKGKTKFFPDKRQKQDVFGWIFYAYRDVLSVKKNEILPLVSPQTKHSYPIPSEEAEELTGVEKSY